MKDLEAACPPNPVEKFGECHSKGGCLENATKGAEAANLRSELAWPASLEHMPDTHRLFPPSLERFLLLI